MLEAHLDEARVAVLADGASPPELLPPPSGRDEERQELFARLRAALLEGQWEPYRAALVRTAALAESLGMDLPAFHFTTARMRDRIIPPLLAAAGPSPERQQEALQALLHLLDFTLATLGEEYLASHRRRLAEKRRRIEEHAQELARSEESLRNQTRILRSILDSMEEAVVVGSGDGQVLFHNQAAEAMWGVSAEDGRSATWLNLYERLLPDGVTPFPPEELPLARALRGLRSDGVEMVVRGPRLAAPIAVRVTGRPLTDEAGRVWGGVALSHDLSGEREAEAMRRKNSELAETSARNAEANRLKSEFLANMSHELRTPLNAIIGFAELMHDGRVGPVPEPHREFLGDILRSSRHLLGLINDLLDLAKVEAGKLEFRPVPVSPREVCAEVSAILRELAAGKRIRVETRVEVEEAVLDPGKLKQVLYNYLSNALKFTPEGGRVSLRVLPEGAERLRLEVEDTGPGIKSEDLERLFTEFGQLNAESGGHPGGTGLGLALTRRIVEAQGGTVGVHSVRGRGSTFFALLPRVTAWTAGERPTAEERPAAPGARRVLVVEDDDRDRAFLVQALAGAGYAVEAVSTGAEALARSRTHAYDAVTLDLLLPDMSGWDVLRGLRASGPNADTPVVVVSVVSEQGQAAGFSVQEVLVKPVEADHLVRTLERLGVRAQGAGRVMVVDDEPSTLRLMDATLRQQGYVPSTFSMGAAALASVEADPPAAIVLDLLMPGMDGFEFLERLRGMPGGRSIPVIVWTVKDLTAEDHTRLRASAQQVVLRKGDGTAGLLTALQACAPVRADAEGPHGP